MILAITGTPGTGKTAVSRAAADLLGYDYVAVNDIAAGADVESVHDPGRDATAVDTDTLVAALQERIEADAVLDGHLAHHYPADITVVLRCAPAELGQRLRAKGWSGEKVEENVEAEVLDVLLQQAVALRDPVYEIDTTGAAPEQVVKAVKKLAAHDPDAEERYAPGHVDWDLDAYYG